MMTDGADRLNPPVSATDETADEAASRYARSGRILHNAPCVLRIPRRDANRAEDSGRGRRLGSLDAGQLPAYSAC